MRPLATAAAGRMARIDIARALIGFVDKVEAGLARLLQASPIRPRPAASRHGVGVTMGLAWRGLAALTGIGLATALVTVFNVIGHGGEAQLSSLTALPVQELRGPETRVQEPRAVRDVRQQPRAAALGQDDWVRINRPMAMFGLDSPELDRQAPAYEARRSPDSSRREDTIVFGGFGEDRPHLVFRLLVAREHEGLTQPFVITLVREAAQRGLSVQRSGAPTAIETKLGAVETTDATLNDGQSSRACIGFRREPGEIHLSIAGWWCGAANRPADRQQLICLIDRLDLLAAGDDRSLRAIFARTELNRQPACSSPRLSASGRKTSWLDGDGKAPALKTAVKR